MPENVELNVKPIIITQDYWKNTAGCQQTFWSSDNRLSPDLKVCWQPVVTRHFQKKKNETKHLVLDIGLDKSGYQVNGFLISRWKYMLWVLIRSASARRF